MILFSISAFEYNAFVIIPDIFRLYFGPLNFTFCLLKSAVRKALIFQILMILNAIIISRYIFIFILKSSSLAEENFWAFFVSVWIKFAALIINQIIFFIPGNLSPTTFICGGKQPESQLPNGNFNVSHIASILTVFIYIIILLRIFHYKRKISPRTKITLNDVFIGMFHAGALVFGAIISRLLNKIDYKDFKIYPNYIYEWLYCLTWPCLIHFATVSAYYARNKEIREFFKLRSANIFRHSKWLFFIKIFVTKSLVSTG